MRLRCGLETCFSAPELTLVKGPFEASGDQP